MTEPDTLRAASPDAEGLSNLEAAWRAIPREDCPVKLVGSGAGVDSILRALALQEERIALHKL